MDPQVHHVHQPLGDRLPKAEDIKQWEPQPDHRPPAQKQEQQTADRQGHTGAAEIVVLERLRTKDADRIQAEPHEDRDEARPGRLEWTSKELVPAQIDETVAGGLEEPRGGGAGGGAVGEIVRFVEENGEVVRMITGDSYADRVRD